MSSINTNLSAMTALQSLKATQTAMNKNQNQISTGLRVSEASHNASYWSISTKMKSDNGALSAVKDSIKQSKAMINTFTSAMDKSLTYLNKMKEGIVAASQPGADLAKIQTEFKANIEGLKSTAASATFNGQNWLNASTSAESTASTSKLVTSYDGQNKSIGTLSIDIQEVRLFDAVDSTKGLLTDVAAIDLNSLVKPSTATFTAADLTNLDDADDLTIAFGDGSTQTFSVPTGTATGDTAAFADAINKSETLGALVEAKVASNGDLVLTSKVAGLNIVDGTEIDIASGGTTAAAAEVAETPGAGTLASFLTDLDTAINEVTSGSAMLGANKALLETQEEFIGVLSDSLTAGVSAFVDADMNEASTRNQALQTQQQLGVQALSMANQNSQMILKLFQ